MKKKTLSLIIAVLLLIPCFVLTVSADTCDISLWTDYKTLTHNGAHYYRIDGSVTEWSYSYSYDGVTYDMDEVKYVDYEISENDVIIDTYIYLTDGSSINASFINENYFDEYNNLLTFPDVYTVDFSGFEYRAASKVEITSNIILDEAITMTGEQLLRGEDFLVKAYSYDDSFFIKKGHVILLDDTYYYLDKYIENDNLFDFFANSKEDISVYKITHPDTISKLDTAYNEEFGIDSTDFLSGDFSASIGIVMIFITAGVIPIALLIIFIMLSSRAKTPIYKKLFKVIWITAACELVLFAVTVVLISLLK